MNLIEIIKVYLNKECNHERLWKNNSGYCFVCEDEKPRELFKNLSVYLGYIKRIKDEE